MCFKLTGDKAAPGEFQVEILEDGSVKVVTGSFPAGSAHMAAEQLMEFLARELGGTQTRMKRKREHTHTHTHSGIKLSGGHKH